MMPAAQRMMPAAQRMMPAAQRMMPPEAMPLTICRATPFLSQFKCFNFGTQIDATMLAEDPRSSKSRFTENLLFPRGGGREHPGSTGSRGKEFEVGVEGISDVSDEYETAAHKGPWISSGRTILQGAKATISPYILSGSYVVYL
eukprot:1150389-Pelagomonas_calceolata.AAC.6